MKLLVLGFDAMDYDILLSRLNIMPTTKEVVKEGALGHSHVEHPYTAPSWISIYTGTKMNKHGVTHNWGLPVDGSETFSSMKRTCVWDELNRRNLTVGVYSMPVTWPPKSVNKWMVSGYPLPNPESNIISFPSLLKELLRDYVADIQQIHEELLKIPEEELRDIAFNVIDKKIITLKKIYEEHPVDVLFIQFGFMDRIFHPYWNTDIVDHCYAKADEVTSELLQCLQPDNIIIVSDHGMDRDNPSIPVGHTYNAVFILHGEKIKPIKFKTSNIDVCPTLLYWMDVPSPLGVDGRVCYEVFGDPWSEEDEEHVKKQLCALGYME